MRTSKELVCGGFRAPTRFGERCQQCTRDLRGEGLTEKLAAAGNEYEPPRHALRLRGRPSMCTRVSLSGPDRSGRCGDAVEQPFDRPGELERGHRAITSRVLVARAVLVSARVRRPLGPRAARSTAGRGEPPSRGGARRSTREAGAASGPPDPRRVRREARLAALELSIAAEAALSDEGVRVDDDRGGCVRAASLARIRRPSTVACHPRPEEAFASTRRYSSPSRGAGLVEPTSPHRSGGGSAASPTTSFSGRRSRRLAVSSRPTRRSRI